MMIYIYIWIVLLLFSFIKENRITNIFYLFLLCFLIFIAGGRALEIGVDTKTYKRIFDYIVNNGYMLSIEPAWNLLAISVGKITSNFNVFLLVISGVTLAPVFWVSKKASLYVFFSIFIYFSMHIYTGSFNATRQYCGLSFILLAFYFLSEKKQLYFYLFLILAVSIHYSSVFALLLLLYKLIPKDKKKLYLALLLTFILGSLINDQILSKLPLFKFQSYITAEGLYKDNFAAAVIMTILMNVFAVIITFTSRDSLIINFWYKAFIFSIFILNLTYTLEYGTRLYNLFSIAHIIFIPLYLKNNRIQQKTIVKFFIVLFYMLLFLRMLINDGNQVTPYKNVFL